MRTAGVAAKHDPGAVLALAKLEVRDLVVHAVAVDVMDGLVFCERAT